MHKLAIAKFIVNYNITMAMNVTHSKYSPVQVYSIKLL